MSKQGSVRGSGADKKKKVGARGFHVESSSGSDENDRGKGRTISSVRNVLRKSKGGRKVEIANADTVVKVIEDVIVKNTSELEGKEKIIVKKEIVMEEEEEIKKKEEEIKRNEGKEGKDEEKKEGVKKKQEKNGEIKRKEEKKNLNC